MEKVPPPFKAIKVKLLLVGQCSPLTIGTIVDTLEEVNRQAKQTVFQIELVEIPMVSWVFPAKITSLPSDSADWVILAGDRLGQIENESIFLEWLPLISKKSRIVMGVKLGVWWMASAGLLDGYSASISTDFYDEFAQKFEAVRFNQRMFDIDTNRVTSAGGFATIDLLLTLVAQQHGAVISEMVRNALNYPQIRSKQKLQHNTDLSIEARADSRLMEALHIMETNLSDPLHSGEIAKLAGLSKRQLERLYKLYLKASPSVYYLNLRLQQARAQLGLTTKSAAQIGAECGFDSPGYFAVCYRKKFGVTPSEQRKLNDS